MTDHDKSFAAFTASRPDRSPRWRADRVQKIIEQQSGRWHPDMDDDITIRAVRFQSVLASVQRKELSDFEAQRTLFNRHHTMTLAYAISASALRPGIEARILAGQSDDEIVSDASGHPEAIDLYEKVFFNVRDRLTDRHYINAVVIGQTAQIGLDQFTIEQAAKFVAYNYGVSALEQLMYGTSARQSVVDADAHLDNSTQNNVRLQVLLATHMMRASKSDVRDLITANLAYTKANQRESSSNEQSEWIASFINSVRKRTPIPRGSAADNIPADSPLRNYHANNVELRADEQLRAASKNGLPYMDALRNFRLRDPGEDE